ncbi:MAG: CHAT domain-containing protein [Anaerolineae bacterium]|nr:CHAT domain-containing protein [Gemmatimonadaceae bacterium]
MPTPADPTSFDEYAFLERLEAADTEKLSQLLLHPAPEEERVLRTYFGDLRYQRLHGLAVRRSSTRGKRGDKGNVVVIHGIMGAELSAFDGERPNRIWMRVLRLLLGGIVNLRLNDDGSGDADAVREIRATGILKNTYGELLLSLAENWNVKPFWFDWRKDIRTAAGQLDVKISEWFGDRTPVHIVAHSMGGLVARTFIKQYPKRWKAMRGRLVMLGTPNHGSFDIPAVLTGADKTVRKLELCDIKHDLGEVLEVLHSFVGSYQMLPSPREMGNIARLYDAETWGSLRKPLSVPQRHLDNAKQFHEWLRDAIDPARMTYIAGYNRPTLCDIRERNWKSLDSLDAFEVTLDGDGRVPHALGKLKGVTTYYVDELHGDLPSNQQVLAALEELLEHGATSRLGTAMPERSARAGPAAETRARAALNVELARDADDETRIDQFVRRMQTRRDGATTPPRVLAEEQRVAQAITRGFLRSPSDERGSSAGIVAPMQTDVLPVRIEVRLVHAAIQNSDSFDTSDMPVDAIAVGHYLGVKPVNAEGAIDAAISSALVADGESIGTSELNIITQYAQRGIIRGELGQPFFLPDPRAEAGAASRVIAIAGLGIPGRCGAPELTVTVRELCWSLGRMGKEHLASVLIGAGNGNLSDNEAIGAWVRGLEEASSNPRQAEKQHLRRVTFVEFDERKTLLIDEALRRHPCRTDANVGARRSRAMGEAGAELQPFAIVYKELGADKRAALRRKAIAKARQRAKAELERDTADSAPDTPPTRLSVGLESDKYRFGAITAVASIPERLITIDPKLVMDVNDQLVSAGDIVTQCERGKLLGHLLIPADLRDQLGGQAPLVVMVDSVTARVHWEMMALTLPAISRGAAAHSNGDGVLTDAERRADEERSFFSLSRGLTRQLRTTLAPPPEPPPPARRTLRVLVVADPGIGQWHLNGAEEEGVLVADLLESYNTIMSATTGNRVEVVRLFGPREATRANVLGHLFLKQFDVLHFAGHCQYTRNEPGRSGWIFGDGELLSANELNRIDRIPKFVFSNACESGITPDDAERRDSGLAPNFAESFFARGVSNFVCTAWPVDDLAAHEFAATMYANLLGLSREAESASAASVKARPHRKNASTERERATTWNGPQQMHVAMRAARLAIAHTPGGVTTWGAYQHYGDPNFRLFEWGVSAEPVVGRKKRKAPSRTGKKTAATRKRTRR